MKTLMNSWSKKIWRHETVPSFCTLSRLRDMIKDDDWYMSECEISSIPILARQARVRRMMVESLALDWAMFPPPRPVRQSLDLQSLADPALQTRPCLASESVGDPLRKYHIYIRSYYHNITYIIWPSSIFLGIILGEFKKIYKFTFSLYQ